MMMNVNKNDYPASSLPVNWWETAAGIARPYLKAEGNTLRDLTASLDDFSAFGIDVLEIFAPMAGGVCYNGLDTIDFYAVDPAIGTMDDLMDLIQAAHERKIAVVLFINLGYGHEQLPAFLKACDDVKEGIDSKEVRQFKWSETGQEHMDRSRAPYFLNDSHGNWRWSDRAGKFYWVKWEGENGGFLLPQFNYGDADWQTEVREILQFWLGTGVDGMVIDAVNWYVDCNWEICRSTLTGPIRAASNQFCQPEGAGGFGDDPVPWIQEGGWNCIMDYAIQLWWEGVDVIRDAILSGDPRPIERTLQSYRDSVVTAGGVCYINPPQMEDQPVHVRLLATALTATMGELLILIGGETQPSPDTYRAGLSHLLHLRKKYPVLGAGGGRRALPTCNDSLYYAFLRFLPGENPVIVVFNFQPTGQRISVDLTGVNVSYLCDLSGEEKIQVEQDQIHLDLPGYGYRILQAQ
jgi:hypothetical protein